MKRRDAEVAETAPLRSPRLCVSKFKKSPDDASRPNAIFKLNGSTTNNTNDTNRREELGGIDSSRIFDLSPHEPVELETSRAVFLSLTIRVIRIIRG